LRGKTLATQKVDLGSLDQIIKKTIEAINSSKGEIYDIAENARNECRRLEEELRQLKTEVRELIDNVKRLEKELVESKRKLASVNKNFEKYTQEELKEAYEKADNLRISLAIKREQEQFLIKRRNDLEIRIKEASKTVQKADDLISHVGVALGCLTGDLMKWSMQIDNMAQRQMMGVKVIQAQEEERQRVAREIHDGAAQSMSNVVLKAEICEKMIDIDIEKSKEELRMLKRVVRDSLQEVRKIIYNLRPMSLDDLGLVPTLQRYTSNFQEETGIFVSFKTRGNYDNIKPVISLTLFRIIQEALNNVRKHANAKNVIIIIEFLKENAKLYVCDDGIGFNIEQLQAKRKDINGGFGLYSMRERIQLLDGNFEISSHHGNGTRINITIPLITDEVVLDG
jgi:two-component system, NarL family, sensor histidine kinase DegS